MDKTEQSNEKKSRLKFFKRLKMSIIDFDKYIVIGAEGVKNSVIYLTELIILFTIIISAALTYKENQIITKACNFASNSIPDFKLENEEFYIESDAPIIIEENEYTKIKFIMDNSDDSDKYKEEISDYDGNVFVFLKSNIVIKTSTNETISESYSDLKSQYGIENITKQELINKFLGDKAYQIYINIGMSIFMVNFVTYLITTIIDVLALSLLGIIITKLMRLPLKYSAVLSIAHSAITLPIILNAIYSVLNTLTGFKMEYFQVMYTLISYVYMIIALLLIRAEKIKKENVIKTTIKIKTNNGEEEKQQEKDNG